MKTKKHKRIEMIPVLKREFKRYIEDKEDMNTCLGVERSK